MVILPSSDGEDEKRFLLYWAPWWKIWEENYLGTQDSKNLFTSYIS
jgi:hypothetical protein